jgi:GntR family transcriptional regulator, carbon starvation induced regulator
MLLAQGDRVGPAPGPKPRGPTLVEHTYSLLRQDLLARRYEAGRPLKVAALAGQFRVSTPLMREVLARLSGEGLVDARPRQGFHVMPVAPAEMRDLVDTFITIETLAMRRALLNGNEAWETRLIEGHKRYAATLASVPAGSARRAGRPLLSPALRRFLDILVSACDSPWLARMRIALQTQMIRYRSPVDTMSGHAASTVEWQRLSEAALARDADQACAILARQLRRSLLKG